MTLSERRNVAIFWLFKQTFNQKAKRFKVSNNFFVIFFKLIFSLFIFPF